MFEKIFKPGGSKESPSAKFVRLVESGYTIETIGLATAAQRYAVKYGLETPDGDLLEMNIEKWADALAACLKHARENGKGTLAKATIQAEKTFQDEIK